MRCVVAREDGSGPVSDRTVESVGETCISVVVVSLPVMTEDDSDAVDGVNQSEGVFDEFEPIDVGETDAVAAEDEFGAE